MYPPVPDSTSCAMKNHPILTAFLVLFGLFFFVFIGVLVVGMQGSGTFSHEPLVVVNIEGPIFDSTEIVKELHELASDESVKAVVIRLDSPGGAVGPSQEIYREVMKLRATKKIVASMGTVAASGAYYIASASHHIVANAGTITGSIGVIMENFGLQELIQKVLVEPRVVKSGTYKDVGSPFRAFTEMDKAYLQQLIDDMYNQFLNDVSVGREIKLEKLKQIADGRIYTGQQALAEGLVDELGNLYDAIGAAQKLAELPADSNIRWPKEPTPLEKFLDGGAGKSMLTVFAERFGLSRIPLLFFAGESL